MDIHLLYKIIKDKGGRLTRTRKAIVESLTDAHCLMSEADIRDRLQQKSIIPDRSTLFRELAFLTKYAIIFKTTISGIHYYEIPHDHHHHLVCLKCHSIDKVEIGNHLEQQEQEITMKNDFLVTNHSLEFYGYCKDCQT